LSNRRFHTDLARASLGSSRSIARYLADGLINRSVCQLESWVDATLIQKCREFGERSEIIFSHLNNDLRPRLSLDLCDAVH
jgi:hypothetical protein